MRISDWSSDVCSSDLGVGLDLAPQPRHLHVDGPLAAVDGAKLRQLLPRQDPPRLGAQRLSRPVSVEVSRTTPPASSSNSRARSKRKSPRRISPPSASGSGAARRSTVRIDRKSTRL